MRVCRKCQLEKEEPEFPIESGYVRWTCKTCKNEISRIGYNTKYKDTIYKKRYDRIQADPVLKEKQNAAQRRWYYENREKRVKQCVEYAGRRRREHLPTRIKDALRSRIYQALAKTKKSCVTRELVGLDIPELKLFLEDKFSDGMNWENWGTEWEIDHIIPLAKFDLTKPEEQKEAFNFKNLQPLWTYLNQKKGCRHNDTIASILRATTTTHTASPSAVSTATCIIPSLIHT